jgi:hypothetical protein
MGRTARGRARGGAWRDGRQAAGPAARRARRALTWSYTKQQAAEGGAGERGHKARALTLLYRGGKGGGCAGGGGAPLARSPAAAEAAASHTSKSGRQKMDGGVGLGAQYRGAGGGAPRRERRAFWGPAAQARRSRRAAPAPPAPAPPQSTMRPVGCLSIARCAMSATLRCISRPCRMLRLLRIRSTASSLGQSSS